MSTSKAQETGQDKFRKLTNLVLMIHKVTKQKKEELDDEVILKSDPRAINILKENAEERSDRELDLAHFKSLFNVFRVRFSMRRLLC